METDAVGKLQKEIRFLKKQVERLEASRATFELMVDRNDNLLSRQLEQTQRQAEELNRINLLADSALELTKAGYWHVPIDGSGWYNSSERAARIFGDPPSPGHRYHLDFWAANVRAGDEAADDVAAHGARADEEAAAQRDPERCRHARLDRADSLPRALDPPPDGRVEHPAARDLQAGEARLVEDLRNAEHLGGRQVSGEGLLREEPDGRVDELRHGP